MTAPTADPFKIYVWGTAFRATGTLTATVGAASASNAQLALASRTPGRFYTITVDPDSAGQTVNLKMVVTNVAGTFANVSIAGVAVDTAGVKDVGIDIKPGSHPNSINLSSGGATPVAILGDGSLDLNDIDLNTLTLGTAGIKTVGKKVPHLLCSIEDVSGDFSGGPEGVPDGFDDLVCHFITVNIVPEVGDTDAKLSGDFISGGSFEGTDSVNIVP